jgi:UDP-N-acetylmuramoyl-L-alanyl-D-glutamate--2,6-diaminopimelate ligase
MFGFLRKLIPDRHPLRLFYHKIKGFIAALINFYPASKLIVIGVTGTNGKTTTVNLITNILTHAGNKVGMASTINFQVGDEKWVNTTKQSTASPFFLQKLLKRMVNEGCKYAVIEVTSHAITQSRVYGINFDIAVITNVTPDHIEYHGSFNAYLNEKGKLFKYVSRGKRKFDIQKTLVMNFEDKYYSYFNQFVADMKITYGIKSGTIFAEKVVKKPEGSDFLLRVPNNAIAINLKLPGEYNIYNSLAAASVALALHVPLQTIKEGLENSTLVSGRFDHVNVGQNFSIIVDYAHTPESLESLFKLYKSLTKGNLYVVFGATGGGRDKAKRPKMGEIADYFADYIILTDDDPYEEDEMKIIDQISEGIKRKEGNRFWKIPNRREALRLALTMAKEGDCVVVAGKGCEEIMIVRGKKVLWNDKKVITELLEREIKIAL